ncbi:MAG: hypothetical protein WCO56_23765, partial [Verrucomicrobiota bacterium]
GLAPAGLSKIEGCTRKIEPKKIEVWSQESAAGGNCCDSKPPHGHDLPRPFRIPNSRVTHSAIRNGLVFIRAIRVIRGKQTGE